MYIMAANTKKQRKHGRNAKSGQNDAYKLEHRHEKSHVRRLSAHLLRYGKRDKKAVETLLWYATNVSLEATRKAQALIARL
jgi:hypothetical protein